MMKKTAKRLPFLVFEMYFLMNYFIIKHDRIREEIKCVVYTRKNERALCELGTCKRRLAGGSLLMNHLFLFKN